MTSARGNAKIIVIILALVALLGVAWYWSNAKIPQQQPAPNTEVNAVTPAHSPCGLDIANPLASTNITVPFTITGTVHSNNSLPCHWTLFEGQAGTIEIRNATTSAIIKHAMPFGPLPMDWMDRAIAGQDVDFSIPVSSLDVAYTGPATIIFQEENPSGEGVPDMLMLNVTIQ